MTKLPMHQNREQLIKRRIRDSELTRLRIGEPERVAYGQAEIERLDIYRTGRAAAPVFVFIHGGAWRSGRSKEFATPAEMFLAAGAHYVVPDFAWVQDVAGSLMVLADQVRHAIAWVSENAAHLGIDPNQIYVGGQSSGGHLAAVALTTDWPRDFGLSATIIVRRPLNREGREFIKERNFKFDLVLASSLLVA
jgi:arylformamidase